MQTRKEWQEAKDKAGLVMPKRGKPDIGPNLDKFHKLKGKDPKAVLAALEKGYDLYEGVPENKKNPKAAALLKSARMDLGLATEAYEGFHSPEALEGRKKKLGEQLEKITPAMIIKDKALRDLFLDYADKKELAGDVVRAAIYVMAGKVKEAAIKYGADDDWNAGSAGRAIYAHYTDPQRRLGKTEYARELGSIQAGQLQMVWGTAAVSLFGRFRKNEAYQLRYVDEVLLKGKTKKLLGA